jgi:hydroxymethylglutaryl-CoA lyase
MADTDEVFKALGMNKHPLAAYRAIWLNTRGLERALENPQVDMDAKLAITASETFVRRNTNRSIADTFAEMPEWIARYREAGIGKGSLTVMAAFGCNFEGRVSEDKVICLIDRAVRLSVDEGLPLECICLADTMGWANPLQVRRLVSRTREAWPEMAIKLHLHDTRGCAVANAVAGMEVGVRDFDAAIGGLGGCPFAGHQGAAGNICTEDLVFACHEMGIETGIDLDALIEAARELEILLGHPLPGKLMKGGSLSRFEHGANRQ